MWAVREGSALLRGKSESDVHWPAENRIKADIRVKEGLLKEVASELGLHVE